MEVEEVEMTIRWVKFRESGGNMLKNLIAKLLGKKLDAELEKLHISKTKVVAVIGVAIGAYNTLAPVFQWAAIPKEMLEILAAAGLWAMRDAIQSPKSTETKSKESEGNTK